MHAVNPVHVLQVEQGMGFVWKKIENNLFCLQVINFVYSYFRLLFLQVPVHVRVNITYMIKSTPT